MTEMRVAKETLLPFPGKILVQEDGFKYQGSIVIPEKAQRRPTTGLVVAVGEGIELVKPGDHILYAQFSGTGIQLKNHPAYRVLVESELLLNIKGDVEIEEVSA